MGCNQYRLLIRLGVCRLQAIQQAQAVDDGFLTSLVHEREQLLQQRVEPQKACASVSPGSMREIVGMHKVSASFCAQAELPFPM
ncbi:MAG: hypothetical protein LLF96_02720 [Eubacteriales bacterium]|nr:hypothetical protein [Eubacteriales bacterium]